MKETQEIKKAEHEQQTLPFDPPLEERVVENNDVPDIETLRSENEELKLSLRLREARDEIGSALKAAGARSPELLFSAAKDLLKFGENGLVENAQAIVSELKQKFPEQFGHARAPSIDGGAGTQNGNAALSKEALSRMKPDEIARLDWASVKQTLSS